MLQSLRENLKGAVAIFVLLIFIVPLVLFGVEQLFVGSAGGSEVATVNGEGISKLQLQREIESEKMRLQQQFNLSATDPQLDDSNLRGPALERLTRRNAMVQATLDGHMGVEKDVLWNDIITMEAFQVDGKFNYDVFKTRISGYYTPATFLDAVAKDYLLRQLNTGLTESTFTTQADLALIAAITQQERTFYAIDIPKIEMEELSVSEQEIKEYYDANTTRYMEPETASIRYIELSLDELAKKHEPAEADVKAAYDIEASEFQAAPKYNIAHILIEDKEGSDKAIAEVQEKLEEGADFAQLAQDYSDDLGSKGNGGELGELYEDAFPKPFVAAAKALQAGEVSGPVKSDSGTHFIKVLSIDDLTPPTFEERKAAIADQIARQNAREEYISSITQLDELTFGVDNLQQAADALGLKVQTSEFFTRNGGPGIAANQDVVAATFAEDVLQQNQNSRVMELPGDKAVVLRLNSHNEAALKPLASVSEEIKKQLVTQKSNELLKQKAEALQAKLVAGEMPEVVAETEGYTYAKHEKAKRNNFEISRAVINKAFELARPSGDSVVYGSVKTAEGYSVVGLMSVTDGSLEALSEQELAGIKNQLAYQIGQMEMSIFEQAVVKQADIEIK